MPTIQTYDIQLCENLGTGDSAAVGASGVYSLAAWGTWGGTAKLQVSPDSGTTWIDYPGASFSANGIFAPVYLGVQQQSRITSTAGSVSATLSSIF